MAIVYKHIRKDTNEVFYIGVGADKRRAYTKKGRNNFWQNIVNKTEYDVIILYTGLSYEEAYHKEKELIAEYGRRDLNKGTLCNLTDGGEGSPNQITTNIKRQKCRIAGANASKNTAAVRDTMLEYWKTNKFTDEQIEKMRAAGKRGGLKTKQNNPNHKPHTKPHTEEAKRKMSEARKEWHANRKSGIL